MKKNHKIKKSITAVLVILLLMCFVPVRFTERSRSQGIRLPWFSFADGISDNKRIDAAVWNYSDLVIRHETEHYDPADIDLEKLTLERSVSLFNRFTIWRSSRYCGYDEAEFVDWDVYEKKIRKIFESEPEPCVELSASELVFEQNKGMQNITVAATPLSGADIKSVKLVNTQSGEEVLMLDKGDGSYVAETVVNTDIVFDTNKLAKSFELKAYADLNGTESWTSLEIKISSPQNYCQDYISGHIFSYIQTASFRLDRDAERKNKLEGIMSRLTDEGYIESYVFNEESGTVSYKISGADGDDARALSYSRKERWRSGITPY